ncbi:hypothetical protein ACIPWL_16480 [Streptomyces sp. NPDC090023]|uniref:hypothetical protein n=1 Tax=unclassified Streptomyces TaxID=2593676 RepID=UPI00380AF49A
MSPQLPPVAPAVTADLVAALSPRLRKRLDAGIAKLADRPVSRDGTTVRVAVDDTAHVELRAPEGTVTRADDIHCGCLLAPACLHRAAVASAAPIAEAVAADTPAVDTETPTRTDRATAEQTTAAHAVRAAAAAVLDAGTDGCGAVLQAELLRAAHTARLAGLPRLAASAVSVVTALRAARSADPAYRLADLAATLGDTLAVAHRLPDAEDSELAELRGTARQPYRPDGSLRLYGLFSEPVLTASGFAGAVTWTADAEGRLYQVSDVAPGGPGRAVGAADRTVRVGDTALTHRELSRAGLAMSGATVSPSGRLGAGAGVRAVRAPGVEWRAEPVDRLWAVPAAEQVARALAGGSDLLFLEVTLSGTAHEAAGDCLLAEYEGGTVRLASAHDDPALPHRDNLRLLAAARGTRLRIVARLTPAPHARAALLATEHPTVTGTRVDVGLDRLQRTDLPTTASAAALDVPPVEEAPVHLLRRRVHQAVAGGRRTLAFPGTLATDVRRLHAHGLGTAADLLAELHASATERSRDVFGRLLPADTTRFARGWLAATRYTAELDRALCAAAWGARAE